MNKAVIVFLKVPRHGQVKTRLTRILDRGLVLELYRAFVLDTLDAVKNCGKVFVFFWPQDQEGDLRKWLVSHNRFICQAGRDLGEKMANAFEMVFKGGINQAVLIGTDIPQIDENLINKAFDRLDQHDMVIGPSMDGGYYLVGFNRVCFDKDVFKEIDWSTQMVLKQQKYAAQTNNLSFGTLETLNDVDTFEDLMDLFEWIAAGKPLGRRTKKLLDRIKSV